MVSKSFEELPNNRIVNVEMWPFFSNFQYGFKSSRSTAGLLIVVLDRTARVFNRAGAT